MSEKIVSIVEVREWLRIYDNNTEEDLSIDQILNLLIDNAEIYIKNSVGDWYKSTPEIENKAKLATLVLVNNWYENRDFTSNVEHVSEKIRHTIHSLFQQMRYCYSEVEKNEI
ncbi:head-tail connector protein [Tissierella creatinophila]|uniref:Phage gp6-like head-tail connector protein n=1 Tax=Tissierella creatinophila DSM 6911 TaxID=1123403 RepID=A0A1U7M6H8_TISCR|nr:head-tail connector protein [Tissierella creatinophila]OLS02886.1 phage gp6-like head-tail connector protein [Tissierella creatinophila DSM 6911]